MFRHYQVVIFKDASGVCKKLRFRGWLFALVLAALAAVVGGNLVLLKYYYNYKQMEKNLADSEKAALDQKSQLLSLSDKVKGLETDLSRIRNFDSKLRLMVNLDQEPKTVNPLGTPEDKDFSQKYLPLYRQEMLTRKLHQFLNDLRSESKLEQVRQQELLTRLESGGNPLGSIPTIWPAEGWISSGFGDRVSPFTGKKEFHKGLDISAPIGTPVYAPGNGKVLFAGDTQGDGVSVTIDHQAGLVTTYTHLRDVAVGQGQTVTRGRLIGHVGDTGQSTGPHLHYEVRLSGVPVNPTRFILD